METRFQILEKTVLKILRAKIPPAKYRRKEKEHQSKITKLKPAVQAAGADLPNATSPLGKIRQVP